MGSRSRLIIKIVIIAILVGGFVFYGIYKAQDFLIGPKIIISYPENGSVVSNSYIEVTGKATHVSLLYLNGRQIFTNENGEFKENLLLAMGYNIIEVRAKDKFDREVKEIREIILK